MNKRKFKINALDIAILAVIVAVIMIVVFQSEINEFLSEPEIHEITLTLSNDSVENALALSFISGDKVNLSFGDATDVKTEATVTEVNVTTIGEDENSSVVITLQFDGYRKFGVFYNVDGQKISGDITVTVYGEGTEFTAVISDVDFVNKSVKQ